MCANNKQNDIVCFLDLSVVNLVIVIMIFIDIVLGVPLAGWLPFSVNFLQNEVEFY